MRVPTWGSVALAGLAALIFAAGRYLPGEEFRFLRLGAPAALAFTSLALHAGSPEQGRVTRLLRLGGDASYTLYLSHTFTANAVAVIWRRYGHGSPWWGVAIAVFTAIGVALLIYRFVERPVTNYLSGVFHRRAADRPG